MQLSSCFRAWDTNPNARAGSPAKIDYLASLLPITVIEFNQLVGLDT
jgi:hypothetical protein